MTPVWMPSRQRLSTTSDEPGVGGDLADAVCAWIEEHRGQVVELLPWQREFLRRLSDRRQDIATTTLDGPR